MKNTKVGKITMFWDVTRGLYAEESAYLGVSNKSDYRMHAHYRIITYCDNENFILSNCTSSQQSKLYVEKNESCFRKLTEHVF
jgi:hypothetical protein